jgi:hypothetical protein
MGKMRLVKLVLVVLMALAVHVGWSQTSPEEPLKYAAAKAVHIFPNPAIDYIHVRLEELPASKIKLSLHNIIGNEVEVETEIVAEHELRVKVKDLASGYYLIAIKDDKSNKFGIYKFVKR